MTALGAHFLMLRAIALALRGAPLQSLLLLLVQNRQQPRAVFAQLTDLLQRFGLSHRQLKAQLEDLLTHFGFLTLELVGRHVSKFPHTVRGLHASPPFSSRMTNFVCTGSF